MLCIQWLGAKNLDVPSCSQLSGQYSEGMAMLDGLTMEQREMLIAAAGLIPDVSANGSKSAVHHILRNC